MAYLENIAYTLRYQNKSLPDAHRIKNLKFFTHLPTLILYSKEMGILSVLQVLKVV